MINFDENCAKMKFSKEQNCAHCHAKCDIYTTLLNSGALSENPAILTAQLRKHEVICKQGTAVTHALFLVKGSAKQYLEGLNNRNIIINILKPPAYIGLLSFFDCAKYSYSVTALEESEVCFIDLALVKKLYIENQELLFCINKTMGQTLSKILSKIVSSNQKHIRGRIAESLIDLAEIYDDTKFQIGLTRKELGEMAAISEENTVRLLSEFSKENIISIKGRSIEILDMAVLQKISELG